jgi:hypothetical protein
MEAMASVTNASTSVMPRRHPECIFMYASLR